MDRSLDEIIAEDTRNPGRPSGGGGPRRQNNPGRRHERDGVRKPYTSDRVDLNLDWVHDKFDDDRSRPSRGGRRGRDGYDTDRSSTLTKVRVDNLHYDITETDLEVRFQSPHQPQYKNTPNKLLR
jgi:THO complex subunit 4